MTLQELYINDKQALAELKDFLIQFLTAQAVEKVFAKGDVAGVAEAKEVFEAAFKELDILFAPKLEPKVINNEAR